MDENEKNNSTPQPDASADKHDDAVSDLLDGASGTTDDFLDQLYSDSFADLSADFDSLLAEFRSIDPDTAGAEASADAAAPDSASESVPESTPDSASAAPEMEDIYSYSDHEAAQSQRKFSESVQQAMEEEEAQAERAEAAAEAFDLSLDELDDTGTDFADAVEQASVSETEQRTQVYSAADVRRAEQETGRAAQRKAAQRRSAQGTPAQTARGKKKGKRSLLPQKNDSTFEIFRKVLFLVSVVVVIVCLGIIGNTYLLQPHLEKNRQDKIDDLLTSGVSDADSFKKAYGDQELPAGARYDLAQFYATNDDFYGYLEIPGTGLSTPVVQGKDNKEYLRKNFFGETTKYGCPFVNVENTYAALDDNTSIFGHNMEYDDLVFGELEKYRTIDGFKKAPLIHLETMYADYTFKVYAVFLSDADADSSGWFFDYIFTQLKDDNERKEYIAEIDQRKLYSTGVDILPSDKLLTLSTCAYDFGSERLVVIGRLVREGEPAEVDVSKAVVNNNPRMPVKYYQRKGKANPYANASKWIPNA